MMKQIIYICVSILLATVNSSGQSFTINGSVIDAESREALPHANIQVAGTTLGATAGLDGTFSLTLSSNAADVNFLIISYVGYQSDTLKVTSKQNRYTISLKADLNSLQEVTVVSATMKEVTKLSSPIPVEIYSPALFYKNPTPSIFESLSMINGVQPQLNCNVCNTGDIHINGMEGPYTMVLIDGMPIVSSLATVYGLAGIPNSLVKRIEIVKGPASTLYGSEAVGGLINIITKEPLSSPRFNADLSISTLAEFNADVTAKIKTSYAQALVGFNYFNFQNLIDVNDDNFTDVTQQQRISIFNKWDFNRKNDRSASLAVRYIYEDRWGGELQWKKSLRGSDQIYGESIFTNRAEIIGRYQIPTLKQKLFFDYSYNYHHQDSYYGTTKYLASQHVAFGQLRWDTKIKGHDLLIGLPLRVTQYDDNTPGTASADTTNNKNKPAITVLPGIFVQDEWLLSNKFTLLTGIRYDRHNEHGGIFSPRLSFKFSPNQLNTFRVSGGNGFRVVNLFTEDHAALTGAREVIIQNKLKPEESWNGNINYTKMISHRAGYINLDASLFYTYFTNKIVGDFLTDPQLIIYDNLDGHAVSKGVTLNTECAFNNGVKILTGVTIMDVYQTEKNEQGIEVNAPQLFAPQISGTYTISYTLPKSSISIDVTGRVNGPMHLPVLPNDYRPSKSPWYNIANVQVSKTMNSGWEFYGGLKNIFNFIPDHPLLNPQAPFSDEFDTSYNYAPVQGIKGFAGVRYTLH